MKQHAGFTLVELMIVVSIVGILAMVALPAYQDYITRGQLTEAMTELSSMRVRLEQHYQDHQDYSTFNCTDVPTAKYFSYSCTLQSLTAFTAVANGATGTRVAGFTYTINEANHKETTAVPTGWTTSSSCWITKKGGIC